MHYIRVLRVGIDKLSTPYSCIAVYEHPHLVNR